MYQAVSVRVTGDQCCYRKTTTPRCWRPTLEWTKNLPRKPLPKPQLDQTMYRLTKDIRLKHFWAQKGMDLADGDYNPKLYIKSDWEPPEATEEIETALTQLRDSLQQQIRTNQRHQRRQHNLYASNRLLLRTLKESQDFIVLPTDKNLGPAILERSVYKK